jgi:nitrogenase molybdenum-iron protein beta chain
MGALQVLLGMKNTMPLIHGSQGCGTYMRFQLTRHFQEPIEVASTSMNEKTVIYGGEYNLLKALKNITEKQSPDLIGVTSSCLTETIGDDMDGIIEKFKKANLGKELPFIVPISTPSYAGTHVEGYDATVKSLVENLARKNHSNGKINIITGNLSPADTGELKSLLEEMNCSHIILTDNSENLDLPLSESALSLYEGGTSVEEVQDTANSTGTIALSKHTDSAGVFLEKKYGVKLISGPMPLGIRNTDTFLESIYELTGLDATPKIEKDRGRLLDAMVDANAYNYARKVAIFGDPDMVSGLARLTSEMGMEPSVLCTGVKSKRFQQDIEVLSAETNHYPLVLAGGDLYDMAEGVNERGADIIIGNSYGAHIAKEMSVPLFRVGFPIFDRVGAQRISTLGYQGGINLVDRLTNTILDYYYDEAGYEIYGEGLEIYEKGVQEENLNGKLPDNGLNREEI